MVDNTSLYQLVIESINLFVSASDLKMDKWYNSVHCEKWLML